MIFGGFGAGNAIVDTVAVKFFKKPINWKQFVIPTLFCSVIARNYYHYQLAQEGDFSRLNRDVVNQLGRPSEINESKIDESKIDCWYYYNDPTDYERWMVFFYRTKNKTLPTSLKVNTLHGIEQALSGNYKSYRKLGY